MSKTKFIILPEQTYQFNKLEADGSTTAIDLSGQDILDVISINLHMIDKVHLPLEMPHGNHNNNG